MVSACGQRSESKPRISLEVQWHVPEARFDIMAAPRTDGPVKCTWTPNTTLPSPHTKDPRYANRLNFFSRFEIGKSLTDCFLPSKCSP